MKRTNTYPKFKELHNTELQELKQAIRQFGGYAHFGYDYTGEGATHTDFPVIAVNVSDEPEDVYIRSCLIDENGNLIIWAEQKSAIDGAFELDTSDIMFGHVGFITDQIPV